MKCRTHQLRERIVSEYEVEPVAIVQLVNNRIMQGDAGKDIKDKYYIFSCINKKYGSKELIYCGNKAAKDFLELTGKQPPIGFDIFHNENGGPVGGGGNSLGDKVPWNTTAKQLHNAIMVLVTQYEMKPGTPIFKIKDQIEKNRNCSPSIQSIKGINTIIGKYNTTINNILDDINNQNPGKTVRHLVFDRLVTALQGEDIINF